MPQINNHGTFRYWILTIPHAHFLPYQPPGVDWIRGQLERGEGGFLHWQIVVCLSRQQRLSWLRRVFGPYHGEPTRSAAADAYAFKEETRVEGTQFELGRKPFDRSSKKDWDSILASARAGTMDGIPSDVVVRHYASLRRIASDNLVPLAIERRIDVFWGPTGVGKSRLAWEQAGLDAYPKDPMSKFWCGYRGHRNVVIDEFRASINISHVLRWFDRYPVIVEIKGGAVVLAAEHIWITTNQDPRRDWYTDVDEETRNALFRRLNITHFDSL